jgi:hypothetical protein
MGQPKGTKTIDGGRDYRWIEAKRYKITGFYLPVVVFVILTKGGISKIGPWPMNRTREEPDHGTLAYFIIRYRYR